MEADFPIIAAHTGCGQAPDNTIESFLEGVRSGANIVEVDLRITKEGTVVLLHDDHPYLHTYTYEQLNQYEVRSSISPIYEQHELVKLTQLLEVAKQYEVALNLDIKIPAAIEPVMKVIKQFDRLDHIFITGCSDQITNGHMDTQVLYNTPREFTAQEQAAYTLYATKVCQTALAGRYYGLNLDYLTCRQELVELAHASGLAVWVYTVNLSADLRRFIEMGVDVITTKEVTLLAELKTGR
ncbi:glycerophosphodiester phosphodiesterase [Paenibacillus sp. SYP-B3998]|uniref:Glycerophosphodiester phosphodiesterase n=1 Tax=Paenibacillus sp. SYP-B3998 TaxID=2678564 RepID=A0A6G3ZS05_9BACL|nr:glycerophosphodiester phosphodiesterase [Paenibacillus sp. SYP-B3998]